MEGYDKRRSLTRPIAVELYNPSSGALMHTGRAFQRQSEVVSFRDRVTGDPVTEKDIDPYNWFLQETAVRRARAAQKANLRGSSEELHHDTGHPFWVEKRYCRSLPAGGQHTYYSGTSPSSLRMSRGPIVASVEVTSAASSRMLFRYASGADGTGSQTSRLTTAYIAKPPKTELLDYGRRAIAEVQPLKPDFDLFRALGELERLPSIPFTGLLRLFAGQKRDSSLTKEIGNEWLNYQFGVKPLWGDIVSFLQSLETATDRLLQLRSDAGKLVRRTHSVPTEILQETFRKEDQVYRYNAGIKLQAFGFNITQSNSTTAQDVTHSRQNTEYSLTQRMSTTLRFAGGFTYYLPVERSLIEKHTSWKSEMERVIRLGPSASAMWELTPWSWLVDWFFAVGKSIASASVASDDNLVINYGYAMREVLMSSYVTAHIVPSSGLAPSFRRVRTETHLQKKERVRCNPYGFITTQEVDWDAYKLGILAALGMSRFG